MGNSLADHQCLGWISAAQSTSGDAGRAGSQGEPCPHPRTDLDFYQLHKFSAEEIPTEEQRRLKFFKDGEHLDADRPPAWVGTGAGY